MKAIRFFPLAFVADVHGFVLFAPYLLLVMALALLAHQWARWRTRLASQTDKPAAEAISPSDPCDPCTLDAMPAIP